MAGLIHFSDSPFSVRASSTELSYIYVRQSSMIGRTPIHSVRQIKTQCHLGRTECLLVVLCLRQTMSVTNPYFMAWSVASDSLLNS